MQNTISPNIDTLSTLPLPPHVRLEHLQPTIGTVVHGLDLSTELAPQIVDFLRALWLKRRVIFFREQELSIEQHIRLGRYFGKLETVLGTANGPDPKKYPELLVLSRGADRSEREAFFHQDVPYSNPPIAGAVALMRACPDYGGDTVYVDMVAAYENLSDWLKRAIVGLEAEHRFDHGIRNYNSKFDQAAIDRIMAHYPPTVHPVVQTHPETGEKVLYVSMAYTSRILGLLQNESASLIKLLSDQNLVPEHQCRFHWAKNSVAIWDNRSTQHYACFDYLGQHRELHRVTILSDKRWG